MSAVKRLFEINLVYPGYAMVGVMCDTTLSKIQNFYLRFIWVDAGGMFN
jgi:hypothetical protein